ncbi:MAG: hypothetical protein AAF694_10655, partial [Bacteroidota bacterium]
MGSFKTVIAWISLLYVIFAFVACTKKDIGFQESPTSYYPRIHPDILHSQLPLEVSETSGIIRVNGNVWTLNDSGNSNQLYELDGISGQLLRSIRVKNGG